MLIYFDLYEDMLDTDGEEFSGVRFAWTSENSMLAPIMLNIRDRIQQFPP